MNAMHDTNLKRADLNLLIVFDAVAKTRSVTAAAEQLWLSQPAVSHALKRLRTLMRDPLFVRGRDGLVLTPRAEGSRAEIESILDAVGRVLAIKHFDPVTATRKFRLAASDYAMMTTIPGIVGRLRATAPLTSIDVAHIDGELPRRTPWNKGKLVGAKPPLRPSHVWSIRTKLQIEGKERDLALFNLAIDSKLRGCDVVAVRVDDVAPSGYSMDRATIRQKKTGRPVRFELTDQTRMAIDDYPRLTGRKSGQFLFAGRRNDDNRGLTTRQYARLVQEWVASIGLDPAKFGTHSLRCTKAVLIYRRTGNLRAVQLLLSHTTYCPRTPDRSQGPLSVPSSVR